jgi:hypothetical protein
VTEQQRHITKRVGAQLRTVLVDTKWNIEITGCWGIEARRIRTDGAQHVGNSVWTSAAQEMTPTTCVTTPRVLRWYTEGTRFLLPIGVGGGHMLSDHQPSALG